MEIRRPLKRAPPKLGPPDIYPQDPKQKEDELTSVNVKQGYTIAPLIAGPNQLDEFGTAKNANIDAFGVYFSALLSEKHRINTIKETQKKKQIVNCKEIWYVHAKTKPAVDNWFRDLANGTKSLGHLGKRIPIFNNKEGMFGQLYESRVPLAKGVWFIKMSAVHAIALSESSSKTKKRQFPDQYQELTAALTKYLKEISIKLSECYQQQQHEEYLSTYNQWQYQTQLARYLFDEGLLDQYDFLCSLLELIEKKRPISDLLVKVICPLILEYVIDFSRSAVLSRRLAHVCAKKLCQALHQHPMSARSMKRNELAQQQQQTPTPPPPSQSASQTPHPQQQNQSQTHQQQQAPSTAISILNSLGFNDNFIARQSSLVSTGSSNKFNQFDGRIPTNHTTSLLRNSSSNSNQLTSNSIIDIVKAQIIESQNNFNENLTDDQENSEINLYKNAIYILSSIVQVICIECPTAMVRHHIVDAKFPSMYQGSPLDHLPCLPSSLPMLESDLNFELRKSIYDAEREILHRSAMVDSKWSCDSSGRVESSKGGLVNRLLTVMDILDKHNFDKIDSINSIDILYQKIFPSSDSNSNTKSVNTQNIQATNDSTNNHSMNFGILDLSSSSTFAQPTVNDHSKKSKHHNQQASSHNTSTHSNQENEQSIANCNIFEEHVIKLLCEWATTTQRTGEHRALVVARLLEKRQSEIQVNLKESMKSVNCPAKSTKNTDDLNTQSSSSVTNSSEATSNFKTEDASENHENSSEQQEEVVQFTFQDSLVQFLDENAPMIEEGQDDNLENKKAFNNLVLLFSELIRCDVFSHYNYMCTLISRGMFNDLSKSSLSNADNSNIDSPAPNSNLNQPGSVKQPKSIGKESDSILANTIQGLASNSNIYPLTVSTNTGNQSNHLDPLSNNKLGSSADQSLRSLGFSPVSSQQNVSQNLDKGHGLSDNHIDDVDADLGKILQDIKEGQQDEAVDILLPDYLESLREESNSISKNPHISKLSPFGLSDRPSTLENPAQTSSGVLSSRNFPTTNSVDTKPTGINPSLDEKISIKNPSEYRHMTFVKHFPVPDDDNFLYDNNQRNILLYGFGKEREEARHTMKKLNKEICRLFHRRANRDINDCGRLKKLATREGFNPESTLHKFETLNHHDQHMITNSLSMTILEMFTGVSNGQTSMLPSLESLSFVFDLFTMASNVSGLLELLVPILEELPDVEAQIKLKCPLLTNQYTHSIATCVIGMLYRYNSCVLLLPKDELYSIFESLQKLVAHIPNPANCMTSAERVIFYYLHDLYSAQTGRLFDQYSGLAQRIKQAFQSPPNIGHHNNIEHEWTQTFLSNIVTQLTSCIYSNSSNNPVLNACSILPISNLNTVQAQLHEITTSIKQQLYSSDSVILRQLNEAPGFRYRFVCDALFFSANSTHPDIVNDIAVLCADVTSKCPALIHDWILALQALCCGAQREIAYRQLLHKINLKDHQVMDNIAIFTAILVARRCLELDEFIIKCAIGAILAPLGAVDKQQSEPGVRLTCHLLLTLFKNRDSPATQSRFSQSTMTNNHNAFGQNFPNYGNSTPSYGNSLLNAMNAQIGLLQPVKEPENNSKQGLCLKYLCDHHLLRSACCSIKTECHITLLKAIRVLAMWASPSNEVEPQSRIKTENHFDDVSMDGLGHVGKDFDAHDGSPGNLNSDSDINVKHINLKTASLHQFADTILRRLCSQRWLHDKCLSDSEIFTTTDTERNILLDPRIDVKQSQRLLYMICYNKSPEKQADVGLDDQGSDQVASIVKMFENLDVWSMRLSLMRLQFMYAYCKSQSNVMLNDWLDNLAKAVVDFFQKTSQDSENQEKDSEGDSNETVKKNSNKISLSGTSSIANINKVWLIEPLLVKLTKPPSAVQSKIIKASAALMESASVRANSLPSLNQTYLSTAAASTKFKERTLSQRGSASTNPSNLASTSLLGFQPFLSLLLGCLKNQDKERETLLTSLNSQLYQAIHEKVDDIQYKHSLQDGLELRLCLIGQMFDTIQKSSNLTSDWATLLLLLIMNSLVDPHVDYGLYVSVLDMLAMLIHSAYASDPIEQKEEAKKQYQNLMRKFRKELAALEEKNFSKLQLISPLMPLARRATEVITCEPMGSLVDTKGEKVENFYSIDKKKGLKVSELHEVNPWDLIEGYKNPAPLNWPWFGTIRLEQKPLRADENNRLMAWHTHSVRHGTSYFCQVPNTDEGPPNAKRSNSEKKPSQSNPLLKSLIEANDDTSLLSKKDNDTSRQSNEDDSMCTDPIDEYYIGRDDLLEDYCELPIDLLFDSTPIETMIEDIKTAMQAQQTALTNARAKTQIVDTKPILSTTQASSILAPVQPNDPSRSATPQLSALNALQNHLNSASTVESSILVGSNPASVPPPPLPASPIVNPHTPEIIPPRPPSNIPKVTPTPPPSVAVRSMSPMVARSPAVAVAATPPPKPKVQRKKRVTKKDANANAVIDANANIPANINKNCNQINMIPSTVTNYASSMDTLNHAANPPMVINQTKLAPNSQPNQIQMLQMRQQQQPTQSMIVRRGPMSQPPQQQQSLQQQLQQQQQQASVYDFQSYQAAQSQPSNQFGNSGPMNYYDQQPTGNSLFGQPVPPQQQQQQQQPPPPQSQQQQHHPMQMGMQAQHQHHPQQNQHQIQAQHMQHQHHQMQYQPPGQHQHQHAPPHQQHMQTQQIRLAGHQQHQQHQQPMQFQQIQQQQQQQQIFAPQQAGHSRPALTAMLNQKHAAASNMDNKLHPQRFNFG